MLGLNNFFKAVLEQGTGLLTYWCDIPHWNLAPFHLSHQNRSLRPIDRNRDCVKGFTNSIFNETGTNAAARRRHSHPKASSTATPTPTCIVATPSVMTIHLEAASADPPGTCHQRQT
mmetsp:Transcript_13879/g.15948  ORF Transcript_13879/g.15948 Transcript_13879/m.15948 type:complete len:117 (+) Transcript_13879:174-524(+)